MQSAEKMKMAIRKLKISDIGLCSKLIYRAIDDGLRGYYTNEQIAEAKSYFSEENLRSNIENRYVAEINGLPIGTMLEEYVEDLARAEGWQHLRVNASYNALAFYQALGFERLGDDEKIHDLGKPMIKSIAFKRRA